MATSGRQRDSSRDTAIHEAVLALLRETSYESLTMDAVAAHARVGKNTIYRRWSGKAELVSDALHALKGPAAFPDQGSLDADLRTVAHLTAAADDVFDVRLIAGLLGALARDADLRAVFTARFLRPRGAELHEVFTRAIARGEIREDADLDVILQAVPALLIYAFITEGQLPDATSLRRSLNELARPLRKDTDA